MKSVRIQSYSGPHFPAFEVIMDQNNSEYGRFLRSAPFSNKNSNSDKTIDAVARKSSVKKAFLEILQNSQETPVLETLF